jgi:hypothetical protein
MHNCFSLQGTLQGTMQGSAVGYEAVHAADEAAVPSTDSGGLMATKQ